MADKKRKPFRGTWSNGHGINSNRFLDLSPLYHCQMPPEEMARLPPNLPRLPALMLARPQRGDLGQDCDGHRQGFCGEGRAKKGWHL